MKKQIRKMFGHLTMFKTYSHSPKQIHKLIETLKDEGVENSKILDIGSYDCLYLDDLKKLGKVTTLDIDNTNHPDILGDVHNLNKIKNKTYDVVTMFNVLEHLHSPHKAMKECSRILKDNGYLLISAPQYWITHGYPSDYFRFTINGLTYLCKQADLHIIKKWSIGSGFLVIFHAIELNLALCRRNLFKMILYNFLAIIFNTLDYLFFKHKDNRKYYDSVGWCIIAKKWSC